ncbi:uncharacterized protein F4812DRAFT_468298 [Daldinia caldariorum]|uniref:uncharacterized protein n=1 Tax=Daldinia caldariorum TaxID=326644 RepID=UPI002008C8AF|nr:uncharacterized protein F4812DRAFT_468298 [Daldinia caldariorum]KAI1463866.1 hypothetical protein F4812DRAFT_468298 [Daldinia caldariorum]
MHLTSANQDPTQYSDDGVDNAENEAAAQEPNSANDSTPENVVTSTRLNPRHSHTVAAEDESDQLAENTAVPPMPNAEVNITVLSGQEDNVQVDIELQQTETNAPTPASTGSPSSSASDLSSTTLVNSEDSYQLSTGASIAVSPDIASDSAGSEINSFGRAPISAQSSTTSGSADTPTAYAATAGSCASVFYSRFAVPHSMSGRSASVNGAAKTGSVKFSNVAAVQHPDGTTSQQPANLPAPSTPSSTPMSEPIQLQPDAAGGSPPSGGPPPPPPLVVPAAAAPDPNPNNAFPPVAPPFGLPVATPVQPVGIVYPVPNPPHLAPNIIPPVGPGSGPAIPNFGGGPPVVILNNAPAPAPPPINPQQQQQQPYLWFNPPLVAPSVPPPPPGTQGSWCYPSPSPFWAGASANQINPPPQFYTAGQAYVAEPAYIVGAAPQQQEQQQQPPPPPPPAGRPPPTPQIPQRDKDGVDWTLWMESGKGRAIRDGYTQRRGIGLPL